MNEFDELLREVLAADARVEPPLGMEKRIAAALFVASKRGPGIQRIVLEGIAATLLIGVPLMMVFRHCDMMAAPSVASEMVSIANTAAPDVRSQIIPTKEFLLREEHRWPSRPVVRFGRSLRRNAPGIAPIAIESLRIKPIDVGSLTLGKSTEHSIGRGEQR